jgi:hypothetical protein
MKAGVSRLLADEGYAATVRSSFTKHVSQHASRDVLERCRALNSFLADNVRLCESLSLPCVCLTVFEAASPAAQCATITPVCDFPLRDGCVWPEPGLMVAIVVLQAWAGQHS